MASAKLRKKRRKSISWLDKKDRRSNLPSIPNQTTLIWSCQATLEANGKMIQVSAMIDPGCTLSFITKRTASTLEARKIPFPTMVTGLGQTQAATSQFRVDITLRAVDKLSDDLLHVSPSIVTSITDDTPANNLSNHGDLDFTRHLKLADPSFGSPGRIDLLLGQDILSRVIKPGLLNSPTSDLFALNTFFGFVIGRKCSSPAQAAKVHVCCIASWDACSNTLLKAFWESEEAPSDVKHMSPEDQSAMDQFSASVSRQPDGRYMVKLPRSELPTLLGQSRSQAVR